MEADNKDEGDKRINPYPELQNLIAARANVMHQIPFQQNSSSSLNSSISSTHINYSSESALYQIDHQRHEFQPIFASSSSSLSTVNRIPQFSFQNESNTFANINSNNRMDDIESSNKQLNEFKVPYQRKPYVRDVRFNDVSTSISIADSDMRQQKKIRRETTNIISSSSYGSTPDSLLVGYDASNQNIRRKSSSYSSSSRGSSPRSLSPRKSSRRQTYQHNEILDVKQGYQYEMNSREQQNRPSEYLSKQPNITPQMRAVLFDWLSEVSQEFVLKRQTVHFAYNYIDRYLTKATEPPIVRTRFQLVGVTALWIAAKVEEIFPPRIRDFALSTDGACSEQDILAFEQEMIKHLDWILLPVTCYSWVCSYLTDINSRLSNNNNNSKQPNKSHHSHSNSNGFEPKVSRNSAPTITRRVHSEFYGTPSTTLFNSDAQSYGSNYSSFSQTFFVTPPIGLQTSNNLCERSESRSASNSPAPPDSQDRNWMLPGGINYDLLSRIMDIIDHFLLYPESILLLPSRIAAAVIFFILPSYMVPDEVIEASTKYTREDMEEYLQWINNFRGLQNNPKPPSKREYIEREIPECDRYAIQRHHPHSMQLFSENLKKIDAGIIEFPINILTQATFDQGSDRFGSEISNEAKEGYDNDEDSFDVEDETDESDHGDDDGNGSVDVEQQYYPKIYNASNHPNELNRRLSEDESYTHSTNMEMSISPERMLQPKESMISDLVADEELEV